MLVTCVYALGVCVASVASGLLVALLLDGPIRGKSIYRTIYFLPAVTSSVAAAIVWKYMLDPAGFLNALLAQGGITGPDWLQHRWLALGALTLLTVWKNLGFNAVLYLAAMQALPASLYEASALDGAHAGDTVAVVGDLGHGADRQRILHPAPAVEHGPHNLLVGEDQTAKFLHSGPPPDWHPDRPPGLKSRPSAACSHCPPCTLRHAIDKFKRIYAKL